MSERRRVIIPLHALRLNSDYPSRYVSIARGAAPIDPSQRSQSLALREDFINVRQLVLHRRELLKSGTIHIEFTWNHPLPPSDSNPHTLPITST